MWEKGKREEYRVERRAIKRYCKYLNYE